VIPSESHAWFRAASRTTLTHINRAAAQAYQDWHQRLFDCREEHDLRSITPGGASRCPAEACAAASRIALELAVIVAIWPEEPRHVLRPSWE
jgi:hypothetical protein